MYPFVPVLPNHLHPANLAWCKNSGGWWRGTQIFLMRGQSKSKASAYFLGQHLLATPLPYISHNSPPELANDLKRAENMSNDWLGNCCMKKQFFLSLASLLSSSHFSFPFIPDLITRKRSEPHILDLMISEYWRRLQYWSHFGHSRFRNHSFPEFRVSC
jgi:hypothetical protein